MASHCEILREQPYAFLIGAAFLYLCVQVISVQKIKNGNVLYEMVKTACNKFISSPGTTSVTFTRRGIRGSSYGKQYRCKQLGWHAHLPEQSMFCNSVDRNQISSREEAKTFHWKPQSVSKHFPVYYSTSSME